MFNIMREIWSASEAASAHKFNTLSRTRAVCLVYSVQYANMRRQSLKMVSIIHSAGSLMDFRLVIPRSLLEGSWLWPDRCDVIHHKLPRLLTPKHVFHPRRIWL